jgi:hypothetical protein
VVFLEGVYARRVPVKHRVDRERRTVALVDDEIGLNEEEVERQRRQVFAEMTDTWIVRQFCEALNELLNRTFRDSFACLLGKV